MDKWYQYVTIYDFLDNFSKEFNSFYDYGFYLVEFEYKYIDSCFVYIKKLKLYLNVKANEKMIGIKDGPIPYCEEMIEGRKMRIFFCEINPIELPSIKEFGLYLIKRFQEIRGINNGNEK